MGKEYRWTLRTEWQAPRWALDAVISVNRRDAL